MHNTRQAADELGVSIRTIHRLVDSGDLTPAVKVPGKTGAFLFEGSEVERVKTLRAETSAA